jgi:hypothetical protein
MSLTKNPFALAAAALLATSALAATVAEAKEIKGNNFVLTTSTSPCKKGEECTLTLRLEAQGSYHINDSYPYKFTPGKKDDKALSENVEYVKENFSKSAGDFKKDAEKVGTMTVRFKPTAAKGKIVGTYKMSVCSEQNCQLEQQEIAVDIDAK